MSQTRFRCRCLRATAYKEVTSHYGRKPWRQMQESNLLSCSYCRIVSTHPSATVRPAGFSPGTRYAGGDRACVVAPGRCVTGCSVSISLSRPFSGLAVGTVSCAQYPGSAWPSDFHGDASKRKEVCTLLCAAAFYGLRHCLKGASINGPLEQVTGVEPVSSAWKADVLAVVLHLRAPRSFPGVTPWPSGNSQWQDSNHNPPLTLRALYPLSYTGMSPNQNCTGATGPGRPFPGAADMYK